MWGVTTPCVTRIQQRLETEGCEPYVFHATGMGGQIMENLAKQGFFDGIVDVTLPEVSIPAIGGEYMKTPYRLEKAGEAGVPRVVSVGGVDMVRFGPPFNLPPIFQGRPFYMHNEELMFVRSTPKENRMVGELIARKLNGSNGPVAVLLPRRGISAVDVSGSEMYDPAADEALFAALRENLRPEIVVEEVDLHINDADFADRAVDLMLAQLQIKPADGIQRGGTE